MKNRCKAAKGARRVTRAAAKAAQAFTANNAAAHSKRTPQQAIEEQRRKRSDTCIKKTKELGELTDTLTCFAYLDPKTQKWNGYVHGPGGQKLPVNIANKLEELRIRGPQIRRRGRARKIDPQSPKPAATAQEIQVVTSEDEAENETNRAYRSPRTPSLILDDASGQDEHFEDSDVPSPEQDRGPEPDAEADKPSGNVTAACQAQPLDSRPILLRGMDGASEDLHLQEDEMWMGDIDDMLNISSLDFEPGFLFDKGPNSGYHSHEQIPQMSGALDGNWDFHNLPLTGAREQNNRPHPGKRILLQDAGEIRNLFLQLETKMADFKTVWNSAPF